MGDRRGYDRRLTGIFFEGLKGFFAVRRPLKCGILLQELKKRSTLV